MRYTSIWFWLCTFLDIIIWTSVLLNAPVTIAINIGWQRKKKEKNRFCSARCCLLIRLSKQNCNPYSGIHQGHGGIVDSRSICFSRRIGLWQTRDFAIKSSFCICICHSVLPNSFHSAICYPKYRRICQNAKHREEVRAKIRKLSAKCRCEFITPRISPKSKYPREDIHA